ncbi:magnesium transporter NIPA-domain-containing protein [Hyaloraphidium curvatum]|nr:magnesium transporter NIPA-domain-containing protein [Hyaloraphidium curvatum]
MLIAGLIAALCGNVFIGAGQTLQKYALNRLSRGDGRPPRTPASTARRLLPRRAKDYEQRTGRPRYTDQTWLAGIMLNYLGEICGNWLALSLTSAAVVTPLGITSVVVNAVLAQKFLGEVIGPVQRRGYYSIMLGVLLIILSAPRNSDEDTAGLLRTVSVLYTGAFSTFVALAMLFLIFLIYWAYVRGHDSVELLVLIVSVFGAISVVSSKSLGTLARIGVTSPDLAGTAGAPPVAGAAAGNLLHSALSLAENGTLLPSSAPHAHAPSQPSSSESISSTLIFLVLSLLGQEFFKQQLLSRFPLTRFQPVHYATFNSLSVVTSIVLFGELRGAGVAAVLRFFGGFFLGMAVVVHGSRLIGAAQDEQPTPGAPLASLIPADIVHGMFEKGPEKEQAD